MSTEKRTPQPRRGESQHGFTLIEVMISMVILTVGLVSLLGVMGMAMAATQGSQQNAIAKQLANEAVEGILTARETANVNWAAIQNTGSGGIFLAGLQPMYKAGADGIIGTADDAAAGFQTLTLPGPDGIYGTADDVNIPLNNYQRSIAIADVPNTNSTLRSVTITIQYQAPQFKIPQNYVLTTFISQFR